MLLNDSPVVAPAAGKFENRGTPPVVVVTGGVPEVEDMEPRLDVPFGFEPLTALTPLPQLKPSWNPRSRLKDRDAETTRTSISTSWLFLSSCAIRRSRVGSTLGMSEMMRALVRSSEITSPRAVRNFLMVGTTVTALA